MTASRSSRRRRATTIWRAPARHLAGLTPQSPLPDVPPPPLSDDEKRALTFPALAWMDAMLGELPAASVKVLAFMPVHVAAQAWPGTRAAAVEAECKARIAAIGRARGAKVIDWRIASPVTTKDENYWDGLHYRLPIAQRIARELTGAVLNGAESADGSYRAARPLTLQPLDRLGLALLLAFADRRGCGAQLRQDLVRPLRDQQRDAELEPDEIECAHVIEQGAERIPEALDVQDQDRLLVPAELRPGELLDQFLQRADAAGQRHEGVGAVEHRSACARACRA